MYACNKHIWNTIKDAHRQADCHRLRWLFCSLYSPIAVPAETQFSCVGWSGCTTCVVKIGFVVSTEKGAIGSQLRRNIPMCWEKFSVIMRIKYSLLPSRVTHGPWPDCLPIVASNARVRSLAIIRLCMIMIALKRSCHLSPAAFWNTSPADGKLDLFCLYQLLVIQHIQVCLSACSLLEPWFFPLVCCSERADGRRNDGSQRGTCDSTHPEVSERTSAPS